MAMSRELADSIDIDTRRHLVGLLAPYVEAQIEESGAKKRKEIIGKAVKEWLEEHDGEELADLEHGLVATLKERGMPGREYDLVSIAKNDPSLFQRLLDLGCLEVSDAKVKVQGQQLAGVERYAFPKRVTRYLDVKKE